jgi:mRNA interferase RelE/StbE
MKIVIKPSLDRDVREIKNKELKDTLWTKIQQIEKAKSIENITGMKLLRGYTTHYRIKVITENYSYRIGAIVRNDSIWLCRFLPRKKVYKLFP